MLGLGLALALAASAGPGILTSLPPAPVKVYGITWERPFVPLRALEWKPVEAGGVTVDPATGIAVFGTRDGWLHAVRPDGSVVWELDAGGKIGPLAIDGDTVYAGSSMGQLHAVAIATGKERWRYKAEEDLTTRPAVRDGALFVASLEDTLYCLDAATGAWRWHHRRESKGAGFTVFGAASAVLGPDAVYGAYSDGFVAALDPATGAVRWERRVSPPGDPADVDALAFDSGRLYAAAYSGAVIGLDAKTGETLWSFAAPAVTQLSVQGGLVIAVTPTTIHALSPADGTAAWSTPLGAGTAAGAPILLGKWLFVPANHGGLRVLELATGRTLRTFDPGTGVSSTPGLRGGRAYVLSNGGDLFAFDVR